VSAEVHRLKLPPHSTEAEMSVLGGAMLEPKAWARVAALVATDDFYRADHRLIFGAVAALAERNQSPDAVVVSEHLQRMGQLEAAGGLPYLARLVEDTPSAANVESYARIVRERATLRRLLEASGRIGALVHEVGDRHADELVAEAQRLLLDLHERGRSGRGLVEGAKLLRDVVDDLARRQDGARGLSVGLADFDEVSYGLDPGDLVVIAGRPGMGKTAMLVSIAAHVSRTTGVAIFSAEMSAQQLLRRCVALLGRVSQGQLRQPSKLTEEDWSSVGDATSKIAQRKLWIDDTPAPSLEHVRAEVLALKARAELGLVFVDYVQLVQGRGGNRYEQLRDVAYGLKALAKEANVPIVLLAQLNRSVETRTDSKRPRLADLRDSGAIEEAADIVGLLYSEGYYNPKCAMPNVLECAIEKNRNGERGLCLWHFAGEYSRVGVLEEGAREQYRRMQAKAQRADDDL
jgi:replicative DNA helicase